MTAGVELLERAMGYTLGNLLLVTPEARSNPTPCTEWDLRVLLLHINHSLLTMHEAITVGHVPLDPGGDYGNPAVDPVASLRNRACKMIGGWANAQGIDEISIADRALAPGVVAATGAVEVAVHGWDVARACGHDRPVPPALAEELLGLSRHLVADGDRPTRFAKPVPVPASAGPSDRLVAFLGRSL